MKEFYKRNKEAQVPDFPTIKFYEMNYNRERVLGLQLAQQLGATKTALVIADQEKNFSDIFQTAVSELGLDTVVKEILQASPVWAHAALVSIPDLGNYREELVKKAAEAPQGAASPGIETPAPTKPILAANVATTTAVFGGPISSITLNNHMAANCQFTAEWYDATEEQPRANYPDWNDWLWSSVLTGGCGQTLKLADIAAKVPNAPLKRGDVIWVYVYVQAGSDKSGRTNLTSFQFTYDDGNPAGVTFGISGTSLQNTLSVESYPSN